MSKRIIASSFALYKFLGELGVDSFEPDEYATILIHNKSLSIPELSEKILQIESNEDFEVRKQIWKVERLRKFLSQLSDQPIVMEMQRTNSFEIENISI